MSSGPWPGAEVVGEASPRRWKADGGNALTGR
jgi:hypothetical protein